MREKPIVKICGLSTLETLDAAIAAGADWVGLVSFPKSPRHVVGERAAALADRARGRAKIVLLTVDADDALLDGLIRDIRPDMLQFHGGETPARVTAAKDRHRLPVMKALGVRLKEDLAAIGPYLGVADHILLDAKPPEGARLPGGNGETFDWTIIEHLSGDFSFVLSGGLTPDNVSDAIQRVRPFGVDVSSGVESEPGVKDIVKIGRFIAAARAAAQSVWPA